MPFMYPEQLRELRAQYPNTQFDGHGRVIGGTPLNQYNAQPANPAAIPASVRTYSQFDPATGTWVRHANGSAPAQSPAPAQGTPINFQQVLGYTPAGFEGAALNVGGRANAQPRQVSRPLARNVNGKQSPDVYADVYAGHAGEDPRAPLNQPAVQLRTVPENAVAFNGMGKTPEGTVFTTPDADTPVTRVVTETNTNGWSDLARKAQDFISPLAAQGATILVNPAAGIGGIASQAINRYATPARAATAVVNPAAAVGGTVGNLISRNPAAASILAGAASPTAALGGAIGQYTAPAAKIGLGLLNPALGIPMLANYLSR